MSAAVDDREVIRDRVSCRELLEDAGHQLRRKTAGGEYAGPCPSCGGTDRFVLFADGGGFLCRGCNSSGDVFDLWLMLNPGRAFPDAVAALSARSGLTPRAVPTANGSRPKPAARAAKAPVVRTRRWPIPGPNSPVAVHVRLDRADGSKDVIWEQPDGAPGLGGLKSRDLPLILSDKITRATTRVIVVEGEPAAESGDALLGDEGTAVVGTVGGSNVTPSPEVLGPLVGSDVYLWSDADQPGAKHMQSIAAALVAMGQPPDRIRIVSWPDAPVSGDLADFVATGNGPEDAWGLIAAAVPFAPADTEHSGDDGVDSDDGSADTIDQEESPPRRSQATQLVNMAIAAGAELFHDANGEPYATFAAGDHRETAAVKSKGFRQSLAHRFYERHGTAAGGQALADASNTLAGKAIFEGPTHPVWCRLATHEGELWLDLGDPQWRAVHITAAGWDVVPSQDVPVKFRRPSGMLSLPSPDHIGSLAALAGFINRARDEDDETFEERLRLITGWLIGTFQMDGGRAILELLGEQGSGKSFLARLLRRIVDPATVPLRTMPRDERDLVIAAANGLVVGYDNAGDLKDWLSDAFCRLSTGGGIGGRALYTDLDEVVLDAQRPCLITSINSVATRSDLLDRTVSVTLPRIPSSERRSEALLTLQFEQAWPGLLGGVLNAVSASLANRGQVRLGRLPRLADFVVHVEAAAPELGWKSGEFVAAFESTRRDVDMVAIEALPIGAALLAFMADRDDWTGTSSALLHVLGSAVDDETRRDRDWPKRGNRLSNQLRQLAPNLRRLGAIVTFNRGGQMGRTVVIHKNKDAWDRHHRHHRHQDGENPSTGAKTDGDDGVRGDRHPSSPDRHSGITANGKTYPENPHEQAKTVPIWDRASVAGDDGVDSDDGLRGSSDAEGVDPTVMKAVAGILALTANELVEYERELAAAPDDDPHIGLEREALAIAMTQREEAV